MISLVILLLYASIAVLDTIHYEDKKTGTTVSILDWIAAPLRQQVEKTYSAPFATHLYTKEMVDAFDGGQVVQDIVDHRLAGHLQERLGLIQGEWVESRGIAGG